MGAKILSKFLWPPAAAHTVVIRDGSLLAVNTGEYLMLPGGLLDAGESFEDAAVRETREETGLEIELRNEIKIERREGLGPAAFFTADVAGGEMQGSWEGEPCWVPLEQVEDHRWRYNRDMRSLIDEAETR
ncbi:NUDIX domain-containing protein [Candidatus Nanohaloarchaea archaeon]|nr:NUDIX domain-containing protein [Candidatus Nanohaloarchaea archaeon]